MPSAAVSAQLCPPIQDPSRTLRELEPKLARIVRAVLGASHPDVDDALQQALMGVARALPAYRGECELLGYARIIAVRAAVAARKRSRVGHARVDGSADMTHVAESRPSPDDDTSSRRRMELLRDLLGELPREQMETLALRTLLGCSLEETALSTGVPVNTVRSRVRLAKERLRHRIEADPGLMESLGVT